MIVQILDVLIGLAIVFLIFSTIASAAIELVEIVIRRRARVLFDGIREIFRAASDGNDKTVEALARSFYQLAPIASQYIGELKASSFDPRKLPSYLSPERFATAIINAGDDTVASRLNKDERLALEEAAGRVLAIALKLYVPPANGAAAIDAKRAALEQFFTDNGDRMTGWYRRHVQWLLLLFGALIAIAFNVNTLTIVKTLSEDDVLRTRIVNQALADMSMKDPSGYAIECKEETGEKTPSPASVEAQTAQCEQELRDGIKRRLGYAHALGLPIGWREDALPSAPCLTLPWFGAWLAMILGWMLTALAVCVGAPFWFKAIGTLASLRTAVKPPDKDEGKASPKPA